MSDFLLLNDEKIILQHQCTIKIQGELMLTNKRVIFRKDGFGKSFLNTGGAALLAAGGFVLGKDFSLPLENIQTVGKKGNVAFQILTTENQTIEGTFVTSNIFKMGTLKNVCTEFVTYLNTVISTKQ